MNTAFFVGKEELAFKKLAKLFGQEPLGFGQPSLI